MYYDVIEARRNKTPIKWTVFT